MTALGKVLIAAPVHAVLTDGLQARGYECMVREKITQYEALTLVKDCVGIITSTRLQLDKALLDAAPGLKWIGRMGSGMEVIDVPYATQRGIACFSSPEGNSNAVAEHALGMLLSLNKKIVAAHNEIQAGKWLRDENRGIELEGKTIGLIGFGHTARAFARKLQNFDMKILAYDKYDNSNFPDYVISCRSLNPIFEQADIISFHVPLQADTYHYFDIDFIEKLQKKPVLINTARGIVVEPEALLGALLSGKLSGACLDVFEEEPLASMPPGTRQIFDQIMKMPQVIVTPHIAGYSHEALYKMSKVLLEKLS